jgi:hypothetical protein
MIYISGPMTGIEDLNFPEFNKAAERLRAQGYEVVNPVDINPDPKADWWDCIIDDILALKQCDSIYMLQGWENSPGANIEWWVAKRHNYQILYERENYN